MKYMTRSEAMIKAQKKYRDKQLADPDYVEKNRERTRYQFKKYYESVKFTEKFRESNRLNAKKFYHNNIEGERAKKLKYYHDNKEVIKAHRIFKNNLIDAEHTEIITKAIEHEKQNKQLSEVILKLNNLISSKNQTSETHDKTATSPILVRDGSTDAKSEVEFVGVRVQSESMQSV